MPDVVKMGVVGAGVLAVRGIMPHLSQPDVRDQVRLQAVCDPVPGRAQAAAEKFGIPAAFENYDEMLAGGGVDAVTIATPIGMHFEHVMKALQAGKHVHINKTMCTTVQEADEIIATAERNSLKVVASPGEMMRPHNQRVRELIQEGAIGTLCWAACGASLGRYHEEEPERQGTDVLSNQDPSWYFRKPGGGPLYDMTVYALHGLTGILGPAKRVTALSGVRIREREFRGQMVECDADDSTLITLDFGNNLFALAYGMAAGALTSGFSGTYFGTSGSIMGMKLNGQPFDYPGSDLAAQAPQGVLGYQWALPHVTEEHRYIDEQHVFEDIMQLVDWVREDKPTVVTAAHARHVVDIIESAYRAADTGQTQELQTTF